MKKFLLFSGIVLIILGGALFWYLSRQAKPAGPGEMVVQGESGPVVVRDIYQARSPEKQPIVFNTERDVIVSDTTHHQTLYFAGDQGFLVTLTDPDIWAAREEAERELLENLGIDQATACKLRVSLGVPYSVHAEASGLDYGLSFCPDGKPLPLQ